MGHGEVPATPDRADPAQTEAARVRLRRVLDGAGPSEVTGDELTPSGESHRSRSDEDYLRDRPPHHG